MKRSERVRAASAKAAGLNDEVQRLVMRAEDTLNALEHREALRNARDAGTDARLRQAMGR